MMASPCSYFSLCAGGLGDPLGLQHGGVGQGIVRLQLHLPTVNDEHHVTEGDASLCHIGRQHHLPLPLQWRLEGFPVFSTRKLGVEDHHASVPAQQGLAAYQVLHDGDVLLPREEHQHGPLHLLSMEVNQ